LIDYETAVARVSTYYIPGIGIPNKE